MTRHILHQLRREAIVLYDITTHQHLSFRLFELFHLVEPHSLCVQNIAGHSTEDTDRGLDYLIANVGFPIASLSLPMIQSFGVVRMKCSFNSVELVSIIMLYLGFWIGIFQNSVCFLSCALVPSHRDTVTATTSSYRFSDRLRSRDLSPESFQCLQEIPQPGLAIGIGKSDGIAGGVTVKVKRLRPLKLPIISRINAEKPPN